MASFNLRQDVANERERKYTATSSPIGSFKNESLRFSY